ncbi:MAG: DUF512 domain-containing protein [Lachnospiraceae bacterium]|nr:DUF512 domain-containing protein [Robinsoniella sp.]MDY3767085.1 DUF512 domain-containing protein [Lachnospiraceae bacterium]
MKTNEHKIDRVLPGSIAQEMEIEPGDILLAIDGKEIEDIFDYRYLVESEQIVVLIRKQNGEEWELEIEKEEYEDLGLEFDNGLMDDYRSCRNKCIFCFIDQLPKGMRETLYFKDDDSRLSYLQGNYVTLTNMSDHDIEKIIRYRLEPINISFQTTNPDLRCKMLHNRFAGEALKKVDRLYEAEIEMNGQIVLCKNINDGQELERTISDLTRYLPYLTSVSVVPVGLSRYRDGLYPLEPFTKEDAKEVLKIVHRWQKKIYQTCGSHFIHASDEWYLLAQEEIPEEERYDGYMQLENGVGMIRSLWEEGKLALEERTGDDRSHKVSIATGRLAADYLQKLADQVTQKYPNVEIMIYPIENKFFGEQITVAGLLTGQDLREQLTGKDLGERLLLSENMFKNGETVFLDDVSAEELEKTLQTKINIVQSSGWDFVEAVLLEKKDEILQNSRKEKHYE